MTQVKKGERKDNKKGPWLVLTYVKEDGTEKTTNIFDAAIIECYKGPGKYEMTWTKNGQYYNVSALELIKLDGAPTGAEPSQNGTAAPAPAAAKPAGVGKAEAALRCLEVAGRIVAAMVDQGQQHYDKAGPDDIAADTRSMAASFLAFVAGVAAPASTTAPKAEKSNVEGA